MTVTVRPLTDDDVATAREVQTAAFAEHDRRWGEPVSQLTPQQIARQEARLRHFLRHDPQGCWAAEADGRVIGTALALRRGRLWGLSQLVVDPGVQSGGAGRRLLDAALTYADPAGPAVILASRDPRAMHLYAAAGFDLHPQVRAAGPVDRARLPAPSRRVRAGGAADYAFADTVDMQVRGAARGPDHEVVGELFGPLFVVDDTDGRGYAWMRGGEVFCLSATDDATATDLLWHCVAHAADVGSQCVVEHINAGQQWAVRVVVLARLSMAPSGPVLWRNGRPPAAHLPSGPYL